VVSSVAAPLPRPLAGKLIRSGWERITVYLPVILMGLLALGTYWLARNTPTVGPAQSQGSPTHDPDSIMRKFSVKTFDANGRLKMEVFGTEARHYPDTDTLEIDEPRIRSFDERGDVTVATASRAISNADASEVQLIGNAVVTRDAPRGGDGSQRPRLQFRGEFLHVFANAERVRSHKPVELTRGDDRFTGDTMEYDNINQVLELKGNVRGTIAPRAP
jgi:lipopolysaccharide export system protein LptC